MFNTVVLCVCHVMVFEQHIVQHGWSQLDSNRCPWNLRAVHDVHLLCHHEIVKYIYRKIYCVFLSQHSWNEFSF